MSPKIETLSTFQFFQKFPDEEAAQKFFETRKRKPPESVMVQALVPEGAIVLPNGHGTAPGLVISGAPLIPSGRAKMLVMLPGPPRELRPMFLEQVLPLIQSEFPPAEPFLCRTLKTTGLGESYLEERIAGLVAHLLPAGLELGYCARIGEVDLRLVARGPNSEIARNRGLETNSSRPLRLRRPGTYAEIGKRGKL